MEDVRIRVIDCPKRFDVEVDKCKKCEFHMGIVNLDVVKCSCVSGVRSNETGKI